MNRKCEILKRGYVTHALTNGDDKIFGMIQGKNYSERDAPFYWSEVYCECGRIHSMCMIVRRGTLLVSPSEDELYDYYLQSYANLHNYNDMIRKAYYLAQDAREVAESYLTEGGYIVEESGNCESYPCPNELDSWSGEINVYNVYDEDDNCIASIGYWCYSEFTYQVMFNDDTNSDSAGIEFTSIEDAKNFINKYKGTDSYYFNDYKGGVVSIYCNETAEDVYQEEL